MPPEAKEDLELTQPLGHILRRVILMALPYRWYLLGGIGLGLLVAGGTLANPVIVGASINEILDTLEPVAGEDNPWTWANVRPLARWLGLMVLFAALEIGFRYANKILMVHLRMKILTDLRHKIYQKLLGQSFTYYDRQDTGQLINRTIGDVNMLRMFYTMVIVHGSEILLFILGAAAVLVFWIDGWVALAVLPFVPLYALGLALFGKYIHPMFHDMRHELDKATQIFSENMQGVQVVRAFGREPEELDRFDGAIGGVLEKWLNLTGIYSIFRPALFGISQVAVLVALSVATYRVLDEAGSPDPALKAGQIFTTYWVVRQMVNRMRRISRMTAMVQHSLVSAERIFEVLDAQPHIESPAEPKRIPEGRGRVTFENVTFAYDEGGPVLEDVSFDVPAGTNVALVGPTGAGKSTLIKLLPRFYDPQEGRILLDGTDIREFDLEKLRAEVGFVFQDTFLFSTSLADNIRFGVPEAERRAVTDAARRAQVEEFAERFEEGYETEVGDRGISLSGGQRQRVAIARALMTDPRVLILDDATASVDATTERAIQEGLSEVMANRTTFIIAHRVSTVKKADLVLVVEGGRIVQQGRHDDLLEKEGPYAEFVRMQWQLGLDEEAGEEVAP